MNCKFCGAQLEENVTVCPACGEIICVDETLDIAEVSCPACGEKLGDIEVCDGNCSECEGSCEDN